jgi:hypothetical protein
MTPIYGWRKETKTAVIQPPPITARPSEPFVGKNLKPIKKLGKKK